MHSQPHYWAKNSFTRMNDYCTRVHYTSKTWKQRAWWGTRNITWSIHYSWCFPAEYVKKEWEFLCSYEGRELFSIHIVLYDTTCRIMHIIKPPNPRPCTKLQNHKDKAVIRAGMHDNQQLPLASQGWLSSIYQTLCSRPYKLSQGSKFPMSINKFDDNFSNYDDVSCSL